MIRNIDQVDLATDDAKAQHILEVTHKGLCMGRRIRFIAATYSRKKVNL